MVDPPSPRKKVMRTLIPSEVEALDHASVAFTMDVCSHIIKGMQSDAMALLDEVLPPGKNGVKMKLTPKADIILSKN